MPNTGAQQSCANGAGRALTGGRGREGIGSETSFPEHRLKRSHLASDIHPEPEQETKRSLTGSPSPRIFEQTGKSPRLGQAEGYKTTRKRRPSLLHEVTPAYGVAAYRSCPKRMVTPIARMVRGEGKPRKDIPPCTC